MENSNENIEFCEIHYDSLNMLRSDAMKKKWWIFVFVLFCFCGCGKKGEQTTEETAVIYTRGQGFAKEGITFLQDSIVQFADFMTGETRPLCSRLNCPHRILTEEEFDNGAEPCMAYVENAYEAVVYREKLYVFSGKKDGVCIWVSNVDGANRKVLTEFEGVNAAGDFSTVFSGNTLVMIGVERSASKSEDGAMELKSLRHLYRVDCESGDVLKTDHSWEHTVQFCGMDGDMAYVYEEYIMPEVYELYTEEELDKNPDLYRPYKKCELWQCSLKDGTATQLLTGKLGADYSVMKVNKEGVVLGGHKQNEEEKHIYYSFANGDEREIPLPQDARVLQMESKSILFTGIEQKENGRENIIYRYFYNDGKIDKMTIDPAFVPIRMLGGKLYCRRGDKTAVVSLENVLKGKPEVCYQMDRSIYDRVR